MNADLKTADVAKSAAVTMDAGVIEMCREYMQMMKDIYEIAESKNKSTRVKRIVENNWFVNRVIKKQLLEQ